MSEEMQNTMVKIKKELKRVQDKISKDILLSDYFVLRKSDQKSFMINHYCSLSQEAVAY